MSVTSACDTSPSRRIRRCCADPLNSPPETGHWRRGWHGRKVPQAAVSRCSNMRVQEAKLTRSRRRRGRARRPRAREGMPAYPRPALSLAASSIRFCATTSTDSFGSDAACPGAEFVRSCDAGNAQASILCSNDIAGMRRRRNHHAFTGRQIEHSAAAR
jgi:hypothetical protein